MMISFLPTSKTAMTMMITTMTTMTSVLAAPAKAKAAVGGNASQARPVSSEPPFLVDSQKPAPPQKAGSSQLNTLPS
jgi:hypothetical protein